MSDTTVTTTGEKERLNVRLDPQSKDRLLQLAGSERQMGDYLSRLINAVADDGRVAPVEGAILDIGSVRQIIDDRPVAHDEVIPSVAARNRGHGGKIAFGVDLWMAGQREVLRFGYDAAGLGWAAGNGYNSTVSQALAVLGASGWGVSGQHGNSLFLQRRVPVAQSLN